MERLNNYPTLRETPVIDWELGMKLAGNNRQLAEDLLNILLKSLPQEIKHIRLAKEKQNHQELLKRLHKLHGAISYCGTARLKNVVASLEFALKRGYENELPELFERFEFECEEVLR